MRYDWREEWLVEKIVASAEIGREDGRVVLIPSVRAMRRSWTLRVSSVQRSHGDWAEGVYDCTQLKYAYPNI